MQHSKSGLFLMEMIISILFFSLASTVCIQLFAKSHLISKQTVEHNHAVMQAQNLAELYIAAEGSIAQMQKFHNAEIFPEVSECTHLFETCYSHTQYSLFFDSKWQECSKKNAVYEAVLVSAYEKSKLYNADITVAALPQSNSANTNKNILYTLKVMHHVPERRGFAYEQ